MKGTGFVIPPRAGITVTVTATPAGGSGSLPGFQVLTAADGTYDSGGLVIFGGPGITAVIVKTSVPGDSAECSVPVGGSTPSQPTLSCAIQTSEDDNGRLVFHISTDGAGRSCEWTGFCRPRI